MIPLNDPIWKTLTGGYHTTFDASPMLGKLENLSLNEANETLWPQLWNELHHQGNVGTASYLAIPHIVRIARTKGAIDLNYFTFIAIVEIERHNPENPELPEAFTIDYHEALKQVPVLIQTLDEDDWTNALAASALAALAASKGNVGLAKVLVELENDEIIRSVYDFIENY